MNSRMDEDCVIQYKITFPDLDADDPHIVDKFKDGQEEDVNKRPVVIVLGWAGSTERHLAKYSQIYNQQSFTTLQYTVPTNVLFFSWNATKLKTISKSLLDVLFEYNLEEHPLFFHVMSNGGCFVYNEITTLIHSVDKYGLLQVQGCIFDSCPGKRRMIKGVKAFMIILRVNVILKYIYGFFLLLCMIGTKIISSLFPCLKYLRKPFQLYENLVYDPARCPQLFLYSSRDNIVLCSDVEEFMARRSQLRVKISFIRWDDSEHVSHLRSHREAYIMQCHDFVYACLNMR